MPWIPGHWEKGHWVHGRFQGFRWIPGHWERGHWVKGHYSPKEEPMLTLLLAIFLLILLAGLFG
jgi:hypothetical protein